MFRSTAILTTVLAACVGSYAASQAIWNPKITSPTAGTVWTAGSVQMVTWCALIPAHNIAHETNVSKLRDTSDAPSTISEASKVVLAKGGVEAAGE